MHPKPRPWEAIVHSEPPRPAPDSNHKIYTKENPWRRSEEASSVPPSWEEGDSSPTPPNPVLLAHVRHGSGQSSQLPRFTPQAHLELPSPASPASPLRRGLVLRPPLR